MGVNKGKKKQNQSPYPLIGRCIYFDTTRPEDCGSMKLEDLSDEHCVPESLNGVFKLRKASCGKCRDMTSAFEGNITHHALGETRAAMQYKTKSKRKKVRPTSYPVEVKIKGKIEVVNMPVEAIVGVVPALDVGVPTYLAEKHFPNDPDLPMGLKGVAGQAVFRSPEKTRAFLDKIGADSINVKLSMSVFDFARLLAKIAYCEAIATFHIHGLGGIDDIEEVYVLPLIRGDISHPWRFIGKAAPILSPENPETNPGAVAISIKDGDILAHIQLFVSVGGPEYLVAVGRASERLRSLLHSEGYDDA